MDDVGDDNLTFHNLNELQNFLKNFTTLHRDPYQYDHGALFCILLACLDNLSKRGIEGDFQSLGDYMTRQQRLFFLRLAEYIGEYEESGMGDEFEDADSEEET